MNRGGNVGGENRGRNREKVDLSYVSLLWFDYVEKANILVIWFILLKQMKIFLEQEKKYIGSVLAN